MELCVKGLGFSYVKGRPVFSNVGFSLSSGDTLSILGANGAGKSTLLGCLAGLIKPEAGQITLGGRDITAMAHSELARCVGYVPQIHSACFAFSLLEYTVMGRTPYISVCSRPSRRDYELARSSLKRVGLGGMEERIFTQLS